MMECTSGDMKLVLIFLGIMVVLWLTWKTCPYRGYMLEYYI